MSKTHNSKLTLETTPKPKPNLAWEEKKSDEKKSEETPLEIDEKAVLNTIHHLNNKALGELFIEKVRNNRVTMVESMLIRIKNIKSKYIKQAIEIAAQNNYVDIFEILINKFKSPNINKIYRIAVNNNSNKIVYSIICNNFKVKTSNINLSLQDAAKNGNKDIINILISIFDIEPYFLQKSLIEGAKHNQYEVCVILSKKIENFSEEDIKNCCLKWYAQNYLMDEVEEIIDSYHIACHEVITFNDSLATNPDIIYFLAYKSTSLNKGFSKQLIGQALLQEKLDFIFPLAYAFIYKMFYSPYSEIKLEELTPDNLKKEVISLVTNIANQISLDINEENRITLESTKNKIKRFLFKNSRTEEKEVNFIDLFQQDENRNKIISESFLENNEISERGIVQIIQEYSNNNLTNLINLAERNFSKILQREEKQENIEITKTQVLENIEEFKQERARIKEERQKSAPANSIEILNHQQLIAARQKQRQKRTNTSSFCHTQ